MEILTLMPARKASPCGISPKESRTGMRCTTLTQLPVAFCGGNRANTEPLAGAPAVALGAARGSRQALAVASARSPSLPSVISDSSIVGPAVEIGCARAGEAHVAAI